MNKTTSCEKCWGGTMRGPRYNHLLDILEYRCDSCGYSMSTPTRDQQEKMRIIQGAFGDLGAKRRSAS